jgi:hypothetical protein
MCASSRGRLAVVQYLVQLGASINNTSHDGNDALLFAALYGYLDVVMFLISRGGDPRVVNQDNCSALTHFHRYRYYRRSPQEQQRAREQILAAWKAGPHPDARWLRRRGLLLMLAGCGFQPLAYRKAQQKAAALPTDAKIPPLPNKTRRERQTLQQSTVLGNLGLMQRVTSFM